MDKNTYKVKEFYEKSTQTYFDLTGGYIHGYASHNEFNVGEYLVNKLIKDKDYILDAGCGMGKLSIDIAQNTSETKIQGITISPVQVSIANRLIQEAKLSDRIIIQTADFHHLNDLFKYATFNVIIFNESLFHSKQPENVISQAYNILKPGGLLYAKDIYRNPSKKNIFINLRMKKVINKIHSNYHYYPQYKKQIEEYVNRIGFEIISFEPPSYPSDFNKMIEFEKKYGIDTYKYIAKTNATHWRELICRKPVN